MGVHVIKVPDVGEGIAEVELVSWSVSIGDPVTRNQILAEVMTDKANVEIPSPTDGVIASLNGEVGGVMAVGSPLIELTIDGPSSAPAIDDVHLSLSVTANVAEPPPPTGVGHSVEHGATTEHSATIEHGAALGDSVTAAVAEIVVDSSQSEPPAPAVAAAPVVTEAPAVADG